MSRCTFNSPSESKPGVRDVKVQTNRPATSAEITAWERTTRCVLPEDLQSFYLTHNGLTLTWNYLYNDSIVSLGRVAIRSLSHLQQLVPTTSSHPSSLQPSLMDLDREEEEEGAHAWRPSFQSCRLFSLDHCPSCGHTCLVYRTPTEEGALATESSVWLLDLSLSWHFLSPSFSDYLRLAVVHLGLRQWPYALTSNQLSPQHQRWFHMFIPKRLEVDEGGPPTGSSDKDTAAITNSLDISKLLHSRTSKDRRLRDSKLAQQSSKKLTACR